MIRMMGATLRSALDLTRPHKRLIRDDRQRAATRPTGRGDRLLADREGSCFDLPG